MLRKLIKRWLRPKHFWRDVGFDELSEIYISMMFRALALSVVGIFVPIYLYKLGYGLTSILLFYGTFSFMRMLCDVLAGYTVARIGPKHTMLMSTFFQIINLALLLSLPQ